MKFDLNTMKNLTFNQDLLRIIQQVSICYQYDFLPSSRVYLEYLLSWTAAAPAWRFSKSNAFSVL